MITHRTISQCKSRTITNPWLTPLMPENGILINPRDVRRLGLGGRVGKAAAAVCLAVEPAEQGPQHEHRPGARGSIMTQRRAPEDVRPNRPARD